MLLKGGRVASIPREQSLMGLLFTPRGGEGVTGVPPNAMEFVSFPQERDPEGQRTDEEFRYHADATGLPKSGVFSGELGGADRGTVGHGENSPNTRWEGLETSLGSTDLSSCQGGPPRGSL